MNSKSSLYNNFYSHIYVEKEILELEETKNILNRFPKSIIIEIDKYMDLFGRTHQQYALQHKSPKLILAKQTGTLVYKGSRNCQSFDHDYFYYTSNMMNCIYDCEYCYLKGMYPSANMVYFVNMEDTFREIEEKLTRHPVYVSISYNTDLLAMEQIFHAVEKWQELAAKHAELTVEIRTKCGNILQWEKLLPLKNMVYAFTISPKKVIDNFEHGSSSLEQRLSCIKSLQEKGYQTRLCFDPMIYCQDWKKEYGRLVEEVFLVVDKEMVLDISVGSFRISQDYLKQLRKNSKASQVAWFPYENRNGVYQYPEELRRDMQEYLYDELTKYVKEEKLFCWEGGIDE